MLSCEDLLVMNNGTIEEKLLAVFGWVLLALLEINMILVFLY